MGVNVILSARFNFNGDDVDLAIKLRELFDRVKMHTPRRGKYYNSDKSLVIDSFNAPHVWSKGHEVRPSMIVRAKSNIEALMQTKSIRAAQIIRTKNSLRIFGIIARHKRNDNKKVLESFMEEVRKIPIVKEVGSIREKYGETKVRTVVITF